MITEKRILPIGIERNGKNHQILEIRPRLVGDMIDALETERAGKNNIYYNLCLTAAQIVKLGDIPKEEITGDLLLSMYEADYGVLFEAVEAIRLRIEGFPGSRAGDVIPKTTSEDVAQGSVGPVKDGVQAE